MNFIYKESLILNSFSEIQLKRKYKMFKRQTHTDRKKHRFFKGVGEGKEDRERKTKE